METLTRRAALVGTLASSVALAAPVNAAPAEHPWDKARQLGHELSDVLNDLRGGAWRATVEPSNSTGSPVRFEDRTPGASSLANLIQRHSDAYREACRTTEALSAVEELWLPELEQPRVQVGRLLRFGRDENGEEVWTPIYAYSHNDIRQELERWISYGTILGPTEKRTAELKVKFAEKHRELRRQQQRYRRAAKRHNLPALNAANDEAFEAEKRAMVDLILCRPRSEAEAKMKRRYMSRAVPFKDDWHLDRRIVVQLIAALSTPSPALNSSEARPA